MLNSGSSRPSWGQTCGQCQPTDTTRFDTRSTANGGCQLALGERGVGTCRPWPPPSRCPTHGCGTLARPQGSPSPLPQLLGPACGGLLAAGRLRAHLVVPAAHAELAAHAVAGGAVVDADAVLGGGEDRVTLSSLRPQPPPCRRLWVLSAASSCEPHSLGGGGGGQDLAARFSRHQSSEGSWEGGWRGGTSSVGRLGERKAGHGCPGGLRGTGLAAAAGRAAVGTAWRRDSARGMGLFVPQCLDHHPGALSPL